MIDFFSTPENTIGAVAALILFALGFIKKEAIGVSARAITSSAVTAKLVSYLKSEYSDDVAKLLSGNKAAYVLELAKYDEKALKTLCEFASNADLNADNARYLEGFSYKKLEILEALSRLSKTTNIVELEKATTFYKEQMERIVYSGGIMPDEMEKALTAHMHDALKIKPKE